jgi:excinuclease ABC subunit A
LQGLILVKDRAMQTEAILIHGARLHNLKNIDVVIPKNQLVVLTGVSGSGKSSLALDILYTEGARQYMESLGLVTDGMSKPQVQSISGLSPAICVDQHPGNRSPRSTVGTATELFTYLRVLFARLGRRPCPQCGQEVPPALVGFTPEEEDEDESDTANNCPHCAAELPVLSMGSFSFNKPAGACPTCTGLGETADVVWTAVFDEDLSLAQGGVKIWDPFNAERFLVNLQRAGEYYGFSFDIHCPLRDLSQPARDLLFYGVNAEAFKRHFPGKKPPATVLKGNFEGVITNLRRRYSDGLSESGLKVKLDGLFARQTCPDCGGTRLRAESRAVQVHGKNIIQLSALALADLSDWLDEMEADLTPEESLVAGPVTADLRERLQRLIDIGVGYLTLQRAYPSLSAGEGQRLRLAALLGSGLTGVLYVLDEPTISLHQRDTARLIAALRKLRDLGNTVVVIEHDLELIAAADHVIEFGPGAGKMGGSVVFSGSPQELALRTDSATGAYLSGSVTFPSRSVRGQPSGELAIYGARENNLKNLEVHLPLGRLVALTGVSGSGKSSLLFDILDRAARRRFNGSQELPGAHDCIRGWERIQRVVTVDQTPIGRVPRSNAATYTDTFAVIRDAFAALPAARQQGLKPGSFSFNVPGGRCERCEGAGVLTVNMHFLPDVQVRCPVCHGRRFKKNILAMQYRGADIAQVLEMTIAEALQHFSDVPEAAQRLSLLAEVGLGYLQLGQPATTLSGGEAQRVKLAKELARSGSGHTLYLLDEPTTGLHPADSARLLALLRRLVDAGNSVMVIEHNLELAAAADWIIDLGPEGGARGGYLLAEGTPQQVASADNSATATCLRQRLPAAG